MLKRFFSCFTFIKSVTTNNWTDVKLQKEFVISLWISQFHDVIRCGNPNSERYAVPENNNFLHNLFFSFF